MDGYITIGTELDTKKFDAQILQLERKANDLEKQLEDPKKLGFSSEDVMQIEVELEKTKNKLIQLRQQKEKLENTKNTQGIITSIDGVGDSLQRSIAKAGRLALSIFGIRSAYMALRRASSELATYDDQYATDLEYIRFVLAQAIAPVLKGIVQLAMQLLSFINMIAQAWFGVNLFANGSAEQFKKMKGQAGGVAKAVKEIKKQLTGFDEVNILSDQSDTGTSAGAGGVTMPSMDISNMQGEPPEWMKWIADHKDVVLPILLGIAGALVAIKVGLGGIMALGIGIAIAGIVVFVQGLLAYLENPTWENFKVMLLGIAIAVAGLALAFGIVPALIAGLIALLVAIGVAIYKHWDEIKEFFKKIPGWINDNILTPIKNFFEGIGKWFAGIPDWIWSKIIEPITNYFANQVKSIIDGVVNAWNFITSLLAGVSDWFRQHITEPILNFLSNMWNNVKQGAQNAWNGVTEIWSKVTSFFSSIFSNAWNAVKNIFSTGGKIFDGIKEGIVNAFKSIVNAIIDGINKVVAVPFNAINGVLNGIRNIKIAGIQPFTFIHTINVPQIPRLKSGGIINMPNRGTLVGGSAIGGEAGQEGVIPLTDQQAMEELGRAIGRNVVINANIVNKMNSRVLSRELTRAQSEENFAFNS